MRASCVKSPLTTTSSGRRSIRQVLKPSQQTGAGPPNWRYERGDDVRQGHVVIAGNAEHRKASCRQPVDESASFLILVDAGSLREIAAHDHQFGPTFDQTGFERSDDGGVVATEMDVRKVGNGGQRLSRLRGR